MDKETGDSQETQPRGWQGSLTWLERVTDRAPCLECGNECIAGRGALICPACRWEVLLFVFACPCGANWAGMAENGDGIYQCPLCRHMTGLGGKAKEKPPAWWQGAGGGIE